MKFYTNKTKPKCNTDIKYYTDYDSIEEVYIVSEKKKELERYEAQWSEIKNNVVIWQYSDNFDYLFRKKLGLKESK